MAYTTANFLSSVERQSFSPANQATFSTSDILAIGDEVLKRHILPAILDVREEYFVTYKDYTIVANTAAYSIHPRSIGMAVREAQLIDGNGNVRNLSRSSLDRLHLYSSSASTPDSFYLRGDKLVLLPTPSSASVSLRQYFALRPGNLIETTDAAVISTIDTATNIITVASIPSTWVTGNVLDLISREGSQQYLSIDLTSSLISGSSITLPSLPSDLAVGDYVCLAGYSPLIQLPPDFQPVLATLTAAQMIGAMNQPSGDKLFSRGMKDLEIAQKMLTPRVIGELETILPDWT